MDPPPVPGSGTVVCQGVVTMTFTWIKDAPDDPEEPPGTDSRWVPILVHPWLCGGLAVKGASNWTASNQDNAFLAKGHYPWPLPMWERLLDGSVLVEGGAPP